MFGEEKKLRDSTTNTNISVTDTSFPISYTKTHKLITALYMVTDIVDSEEPIRNKLRTLGTGIISDIYMLPSNSLVKISQIMSFLDIASAVNIISEMNCNILRKEFLQLDRAIKESIGGSYLLNRPINLSEFLVEDLPGIGQITPKHQNKSIGHQYPTRIGVQKGSTLMKALSDKTNLLSDRNPSDGGKANFDILKKQRRFDIINVIKNNNGNATIKDIRTKINTGTQSTMSYSEKTLQRELISMIKDGVLNKTGEKRWSRYFIK